ncbi:MAG TPA: L-threonylcarbamoyladenylate synthase, partial [Acidimicrobiia bacterium]|nr:L-threonylcarbamoyladenylate synthase [Acidimicrobiia bacterium]
MNPLQLALTHLREGRVVGVPTDTVYGLAADPLQPLAVEALFELKGRDRSKPVGLLVADASTAQAWVQLPEYAVPWAERFWPGPLTLVGHPRRTLPEGVGDHQRHTVGVRVPDHPVIRQLLEAWGPLAVTSANRSGEAETL